MNVKIKKTLYGAIFGFITFSILLVSIMELLEEKERQDQATAGM